jgi:hypothetical protein
MPSTRLRFSSRPRSQRTTLGGWPRLDATGRFWSDYARTSTAHVVFRYSHALTASVASSVAMVRSSFATPGVKSGNSRMRSGQRAVSHRTSDTAKSTAMPITSVRGSR